MAGYSNEFKVGLFVAGAVSIIITGYMWSFDGVHAAEPQYQVHVGVPSADGLWVGTPVKLAGVEIGAIESIDIDGSRARLRLTIREAYQLSVDSAVELKSSGLLGDRYVAVFPGTEDALVQDEGVLELRHKGGDLDQITQQVEDITADVKAITKVVRELVENEKNTEHIEASLANVDALTESLKLIVTENRRDIAAITDSIRRLSESLELYAKDASGGINEEIDKIQHATDTLQRSLESVESITSKIDEGHGTVGALINERETIDALNDTIGNANEVIESFSGLRAEVYWHHRYYIGTQPNSDAFLYGNPLGIPDDENDRIGTSGSNVLGIRLRPQEDFYWSFEINDYPTGTLNYEERFIPELGEMYTTWVREPKVRWTFQMHKRWYDFEGRLGIKESGGGFGGSYFFAEDKVRVDADLFDFTFGSYPAIEASGLPNLRLGVTWSPSRNVYFHAGAEQVLLGARYGYGTGFIGGGFRFDDDDIKLLFAMLPISF
jgi:phospholipid/cholesterol/gamma-HCH transport system substrate-binding protein